MPVRTFHSEWSPVHQPLSRSIDSTVDSNARSSVCDVMGVGSSKALRVTLPIARTSILPVTAAVMRAVRYSLSRSIRSRIFSNQGVDSLRLSVEERTNGPSVRRRAVRGSRDCAYDVLTVDVHARHAILAPCTLSEEVNQSKRINCVVEDEIKKVATCLYRACGFNHQELPRQ